jgi:predicted metal-dependent phosphoesterase TrpH
MTDTIKSSTTGLTLTPDSVVDLHLHTTFSDGHWELEPLIDHLLREGFSLAAITDHDRPDIVAMVQQLALEINLPTLVGVEMSTVWQDELTDQRRDQLSGLLEMTDLLCYGFDPDRNALFNLAQDLLRRQRENTREVYENLLQQGYRFPQSSGDLATILEVPALRQPHKLADLLLRHGYGTGEPSAGRILLEAGCTYALNDLAVVVDATHQDGGVCLLAHPGHKEGGFVTYDLQMLDKLRWEVPIDGLEVYHPRHTPEQTEMYLEYAQRNHLLVSAGSDSHGPDKPPIKYRAELVHGLLERLGFRIE